MNTYRISIQKREWRRAREFDVDALLPRVAISRALDGIDNSDVITVGCRLYAKNVLHDNVAPKVRPV